MRTFAVIHVSDVVDIWKNVVEKLPMGSRVLFFTRKSQDDDKLKAKISEFGRDFDIHSRIYPDELRFHTPKLRNFVMRTLMDEKTEGFLHVIENEVEIFGQVEPFLVEIERMMQVFRLKSWFNTSCDICNYVYSKYNPRFYVSVDEDDTRQKYGKVVAWCSNANNVWSCYNMDSATFEDVRMEENLQFPMYYIIEFLARRRNSKSVGQLDYMNLYPSVEEELNVFRTVDVPDARKFTDAEIKADAEIFGKMKVDNHPDSTLEVVMDDMRAAILDA